ncbi:hypothetical protein [Lysobacter gummosus]|uniref:hypothetical protein n=1 Tax=Lysobacter gummosus TaxID=262324 RepID=UPI003644A1BC
MAAASTLRGGCCGRWLAEATRQISKRVRAPERSCPLAAVCRGLLWEGLQPLPQSLRFTPSSSRRSRSPCAPARTTAGRSPPRDQRVKASLSHAARCAGGAASRPARNRSRSCG